MYEHLERATGLLAYLADFIERQLTRKRYAIGPEALREPNALSIGDAHLRAGVQFHIRRHFAQQFQNAEILDNQRIRASLDDRRGNARGFAQFMLEYQCVESDVAAYAAPVERPHHLRQFFEGEADFGPRGEMFQPEIDSIRARLNRGTQLWPVTGRAHDFRFRQTYYQRSASDHGIESSAG